MLEIIKWIWQLPQNLIGIILRYILHKADNTFYIDNCKVFQYKKLRSGFSLGKYIFIKRYPSSIRIHHEIGHSKQSLILGPLYIIVIAIPSVLHYWINQILKKKGIKHDYYSFYTEKWADKLGKVKRNKK